jgi:hypothetical protein
MRWSPITLARTPCRWIGRLVRVGAIAPPRPRILRTQDEPGRADADSKPQGTVDKAAEAGRHARVRSGPLVRILLRRGLVELPAHVRHRGVVGSEAGCGRVLGGSGDDRESPGGRCALSERDRVRGPVSDGRGERVVRPEPEAVGVRALRREGEELAGVSSPPASGRMARWSDGLGATVSRMCGCPCPLRLPPHSPGKRSRRFRCSPRPTGVSSWSARASRARGWSCPR